VSHETKGGGHHRPIEPDDRSPPGLIAFELHGHLTHQAPSREAVCEEDLRRTITWALERTAVVAAAG
jgi:hypothetical protein